MTTVADVIARVRRDYLNYGQREPRNRLTASIDGTVTTLTFTETLTSLQPNSYLSIGLEDLYVWTTDDAAKTADVDRGVDGSTATSHVTTEAVRVNPRWSDATILRAINAELGNLHAQGLFKVGSRDITWTSANVGYEITGIIDDVYMVQAQDYAGRDWLEIKGFNFERGQDTSVFPSGYALFVWGGAIDGNTIRLTTFEPFTVVDSLTDDLTVDAGLPATAVDVLAMGVALGLGAGREVSRNDTRAQGDTRRAAEVPPGAQAGSTNPIRAWYQARLRNEVMLLSQRYPPRRR